MRDRLIELIESARYWGANTSEEIADKLIAEGVIVPKLKKGDKVYYISASNNIVENKVYYVGAYSRALCYMTNGKPLLDNVFLDADDYYFTREEAERALAERSENGKS